jgi:hypothetical protein
MAGGSNLTLRAGWAGVASLLAVAAGLVPAAEGSTHVTVRELGQQQGVALMYVKGDDRGNAIAVELAPRAGAVVISDRRLITAPDCDRISPLRVSCPSRASGLTAANRIDIYGDAGRDILELRRSLPQTYRALMRGNKGADRLIGGSDEDHLIGHRGNDDLFGRGGNDRLDGESGNFIRHEHPGRDLLSGGPGDDDMGLRYEVGADVYLGGRGRDLLRAHDSERDLVLDAGRGDDRCWFDRFDLRPANCEKAELIRPDNPPR